MIHGNCFHCGVLSLDALSGQDDISINEYNLMTENITVVAHITADPLWANDVLKALHKAVDQTQSEEGCLYYQLFRNIYTANQWTMLELWKDEQSLIVHNNALSRRELGSAIDGKAKVEVFKLMPTSSMTDFENVQNPAFWLGNGLP